MNFTDLKDFLDLVKNPTKYENVINQFEEREKRWTELVNAHTEISQVGKYVADKEAQARETLAEAVTKLNEAQAEADKQKAYVNQLVSETEAFKAEAAADNAEAKALLKQVKADKKEVDDLKDSWQKELDLVRSRNVTLLETQAQLDAKLEAFKAIVS